MASFATPDQLAARLGITLAGDDATRAATLIELASGVVQDAVGQVIELVADDVLTRRGTRESTLLLPERPVVSVSSVTLDGETIDADSYYIDGDHLVRVGGWGHAGEALVITYTHGFDPVPEAVVTEVLEMTARVWTNPSGAMIYRLGQAGATYSLQAPPPGLAVDAATRRRLRRLVGRRSEPLPIR